MKDFLSKQIPHYKTTQILNVDVPHWDEFSFENVIKVYELKDYTTICQMIPEIEEDKKVVRDREFFLMS